MSIAELKGYVLGMCLSVAMAGCSGTVGSTPAPPGSGPTATPPPSNPIQHVVVLVQENRSFNNLFAGFPGADTAMKGLCKPAPHATWCKTQREVPLKSVTLEKGTGVFRGTDICHSHGCFEIECDANASNVCQMDGFDLIAIGETSNGRPAKLFPYAYVDRSETKPYWDLARQYTLADEMFFTETASSFLAHQMLISGTARLNDDQWVTDQPNVAPWGCFSDPGDNAPTLNKNGKVSYRPGVFPCFKWATIADLLDAKKVSWLDYVDQNPVPMGDFSGAVWNGFAAIHKIYYGPDWKTNISSPNTNIFADVKTGKLPAVSWVTPSLADSDHPASGCNGGPWWVTKVVNAIGTSRYWKSTAIVLLWDDWGGWYDNAPPKILNPSALGFRVPMIVISPYAKSGFVSHSQYDFGSILKFTEQTFGLGSLGTTDKSATSMDDIFDFTQTPLKFKPAPLPPAMNCKDQVTNPKQMREILENDNGVPE